MFSTVCGGRNPTRENAGRRCSEHQKGIHEGAWTRIFAPLPQSASGWVASTGENYRLVPESGPLAPLSPPCLRTARSTGSTAHINLSPSAPNVAGGTHLAPAARNAAGPLLHSSCTLPEHLMSVVGPATLDLSPESCYVPGAPMSRKTRQPRMFLWQHRSTSHHGDTETRRAATEEGLVGTV
jgi:hypothetical protein